MRPSLIVVACLAVSSCASRAPVATTPHRAERDRAPDSAPPATFVERTRERLAREQQRAELDERRDDYMHRQNGKAGR